MPYKNNDYVLTIRLLHAMQAWRSISMSTMLPGRVWGTQDLKLGRELGSGI